MRLKIIYIVTIWLGLISCEDKMKRVTLTVENKISNSRITNIFWENRIVSSELITNEGSDLLIIDEEDRFPKTSTITFRLQGNGQVVFLETEESFTIYADEDKTIVLTDETPVKRFSEENNQP